MANIPNPAASLVAPIGKAEGAVRSGVALASAARTAAPPGVVFSTSGAVGLEVVLDVTADTGGNTVTLTISGADRASGKLWTVLASAAKASSTTTVLRVNQNLAASANLIAQDMVPPEVAITVAHSDSAAITYSIGVHLTY